MASKRFQRGGLDQGLAEFLGLKGRYSATISDELVPTVQVADLSASPYAADYFPVGRALSIAALALNYPYLVVVPGDNMTLQVEQVRVLNPSGVAIRAQAVLLTQADIAILIATGVLNSTGTMLGRVLGRPPSPDIVPERSSAIQSIHSTTLNISAPLDVIDLAALTSTMMNLPSPGVILTDDRGASDPGGLAIVSSTIAQSLWISVAGREWPIPG